MKKFKYKGSLTNINLAEIYDIKIYSSSVFNVEKSLRSKTNVSWPTLIKLSENKTYLRLILNNNDPTFYAFNPLFNYERNQTN